MNVLKRVKYPLVCCYCLGLVELSLLRDKAFRDLLRLNRGSKALSNQTTFVGLGEGHLNLVPILSVWRASL